MWPIRPPPVAWCWRVHSQDADARVAAGEWHAAARAKIQQYIARHRPQDALRVTDYMDTLMLGLSAKAREGDSLPRLLETVRLAGLALAHPASLSRQMVCPPDTSIRWAVTQRLSSRSRLAIISSGTPTRPSAVMAANCAFTSASSRTSPPPKSVAIAPGAMVLTVMPRPPSSRAMYTLSISTAALAAA